MFDTFLNVSLSINKPYLRIWCQYRNKFWNVTNYFNGRSCQTAMQKALALWCWSHMTQIQSNTQHTKISSDTPRHKYTLMHACLHAYVSQQMNLTVATVTTKVTVWCKFVLVVFSLISIFHLLSHLVNGALARTTTMGQSSRHCILQ